MNGRRRSAAVLLTPDGRYIVVRGRLWRAANPALDPDERVRLQSELMAARRAVAAALRAEDQAGLVQARRAVEDAKLLSASEVRCGGKTAHQTPIGLLCARHPTRTGLRACPRTIEFAGTRVRPHTPVSRSA